MDAVRRRVTFQQPEDHDMQRRVRLGLLGRTWQSPLAGGLLCLFLLVGTAGAGPGQEKAEPSKSGDAPLPAPQKEHDKPTEETNAKELAQGAGKAAAGKTATGAGSKTGTTKAVVAVLETLEKSLSKVRTVETDFTQTKVLKLFKKPIVLKGHMFLAFPDRLAWHVATPIRYSLVLDKEELSQWDEDTDEVQRISLASNPTFKTVSQQIRKWFSGKYTVLVKEYDVTVEAKEPELRLAFVPRAGTLARKALRKVSVTFAADRAYVRTIRFEDTTGDESTLAFTNTKVDQPIPKSAWQPRRGDK